MLIQIVTHHKYKNSPLLKLRRGNESSCTILHVLQLALPPVVVIFTDDLDYVSNPEANTRFFTWDEVIFGGIILKLCTYENLRTKVDILTVRLLTDIKMLEERKGEQNNRQR